MPDVLIAQGESRTSSLESRARRSAPATSQRHAGESCPPTSPISWRTLADRANFRGGSPFRDVDSPDRGCSIAARLRTIKEPLKIAFKVLLVLRCRDAIDAYRSIFASSTVRFRKPVDVHEVSQRSESHLRRLVRQFSYPSLFRGHSFRISMHSMCFSR